MKLPTTTRLTTNLIQPILLIFTFPQPIHTQTPQQLNITALSASNNASNLQCWTLTTPFTVSTERGIVGALSLPLTQTINATYTIIKPHSNGGLHNAPRVQWAFFVSGLAHITLPNGTDDAWIMGGRYGALFVADTSDVSAFGHGTEYPGDAETVVLTVPVEDGAVPEHTVLYEGACRLGELVGS